MLGKCGKTSVYIIVLALGMVAGVLFGGKIAALLQEKGVLPQSNQLVTSKAADYDGTNKPEVSAGGELALREAAIDAVSTTRRNAIVTATRKVAPCVVGIVVTQIQVVKNQYSNSDFFDFFFGPEMQPQYRQVESIGSGFVIRQDGIILTNFHVVQNAAQLYVNFSDGRRFEGSIVGVDERADLAVIAVEGSNLPCATFGNADEAMGDSHRQPVS
jgi:S1-C subfamily serine protease